MIISSKGRLGIRKSWLRRASSAWLAALLLISGAAHAEDLFHNDKAIHPACLEALTRATEGEKFPVTLAVSLLGCEASSRSEIPVRRAEGISTIEDEALLGGEAFSYHALGQLNNGIYAVAVRRTSPDGAERISLAAIDIVARPMLVSGQIITVPMLELLARVSLPEAEFKSFRKVDNTVQVRAGPGARAIDRTVDLTALGKARKSRR